MELWILWFVAAVVVSVAAHGRGRNSFAWFFLAVLFTPLLMGILVLVMPRVVRQDQQQESVACPMCAERVLAAAIKCKHCGADLSQAKQQRDAAIQAELDRYAEVNRALAKERQQAAEAVGRFYARLVPWRRKPPQ